MRFEKVYYVMRYMSLKIGIKKKSNNMQKFYCFMFIVSSAYYAYAVEYTQPYAPYYSQCGQDKYVNEYIFKGAKQGFFIDVGAHDGISYSNTYYFEQILGWRGICIEPHQDHFTQLCRNRSAICINAGISNYQGSAQFLKIIGEPEMLSGLVHTYDPRHVARIEYELQSRGGSAHIVSVPVYTLQAIVDAYRIARIDLLSIDTEGGELLILHSINLHTVDVRVIVVENNYDTTDIHAYLVSMGYQLRARLGGDCVYTKL